MRLRVLADIPESPLSDIRQHPPPRLPIGRLKRSKIKKPPLAVKKTGCSPEQKELLREAPPQQPEAPPQPSLGEGVGWGSSWLVRTPGNSDRVAIT